MKKKECSCDNEMLTALIIGVGAGCLIGFVFGWLWRDRPGALANVSIVAVMTAVGTVGATFAAVFFGLSDQRNRKSVRNQRLTSVSWLVDEAVQSAKWVSRHLKNISENKMKMEIPLAENELSAFLTSMDAINGIPFHEEHYSEAHRYLVSALAALRSLSPLIAKLLSDKPEKIDATRVVDLVEQAEDELEEALGAFPFKGIPRIGRLYF